MVQAEIRCTDGFGDMVKTEMCCFLQEDQEGNPPG
jgi:hypothetical protein